jgi:hypothetical protein
LTDRSLSALSLTDDDRSFLEAAAAFLERPGFLTSIANLVGKPAETLLGFLPDRAQQKIGEATQAALRRGVDWAVNSIPAKRAGGIVSRQGETSFFEKHRHTAVAAISGAGGGFFGLAGLPVEVPLTTLVMLRSIACIAAESGADLSDPQTRLECLTVFSLGSPAEDEMESAYFTSRLGLAMAVKQAAEFVATSSARQLSEALAQGSGPLLVRLINAVAARFEIVVTQKVAAQSIPVLGAAMGALINASFTDYFNQVARYHFGVLSLERQYGREAVQAEYFAVRQRKK